MRKVLAIFFVLLFVLPSLEAKETPFQTLDWPDAGGPLIRFTFAKFKMVMGGQAKEHPYLADVTAENLSDKTMSSVNLLLYIFDKTHARIGDGNINLTNVGSHQVVKFEMTVFATGTPASLSLAASTQRTLSVTINSVPQGAVLKLDGKEMGTTPKMAEVTIGKHLLEFSKEGYNSGKFPLEMGPRDASGGSVSYELGISNHDTIELRDGSVLSGDLISVDTKEAQIRIGGNIQTLDRNQIKRVSLTQRDPVAQ